MKYHQPFDLPSNPNAAYVDGNPGAGVSGSIPPAASIEYPQREIVNFITDSGLTPADADLHQLSESVQAGKVSFGVDTGSANALSVALTPVPPAYTPGMRVYILVGNSITGATTINCNGLGNKTAHLNGAALPNGCLSAGDIGEF